ncbi:MAG: RDD family protein [Nocardiopsaceae bacterium]|nr:RDD family protein [Nocardiopsaceae bacterium]
MSHPAPGQPPNDDGFHHPYGQPRQPGDPYGTPQQPYAGPQPPYGTPGPGGVRLAEWWKRLLARIIDVLVLLIPAFILQFIIAIGYLGIVGVGPHRSPNTFPMGGGGRDGILLLDAISSLLMLALLFGYEVWMLSRWGRTVGKMAMGLRVVPLSGTAHPRAGGLPASTAAIRALVWWGPWGLNWIPLIGAIIGFFPLLNGLWPLWDKPNQQSLNDKAAATIVTAER